MSRIRSWFHVLAVGLLLAVLVPSVARADYRLAPGDSIAFSVLGFPDLGRTSVIDVSGAVYLPLAGQFHAAGKTVAALREEVAKALGHTSFRVLTATGEEVWREIRPEEVVIDIAGYRPVYVMGDVARTGEVPYRPGLTVQQALASAGGVNVLGAAGKDMGLQLLSARSDVTLLEISVADEKAVVARLRSGLTALRAKDGATTETTADKASEPVVAAAGSALDIPVAGDVVDINKSIAQTDTRSLQLAEIGTAQTLKQMRNRLDVLKKQEAADQEALTIEQQRVARMQKLADKGVSTASAAADARLMLLQAASRVLQTSDDVFRLRVEISSMDSESARTRAKTESDLLQQLAGHVSALNQAEEKLRVARTRVAMLGTMSLSGDAEHTVEMTLFRSANAGGPGIEAKRETGLEPGDVLEVHIVLGEKAAQQQKALPPSSAPVSDLGPSAGASRRRAQAFDGTDANPTGKNPG